MSVKAEYSSQAIGPGEPLFWYCFRLPCKSNGFEHWNDTSTPEIYIFLHYTSRRHPLVQIWSNWKEIVYREFRFLSCCTESWANSCHPRILPASLVHGFLSFHSIQLCLINGYLKGSERGQGSGWPCRWGCQLRRGRLQSQWWKSHLHPWLPLHLLGPLQLCTHVAWPAQSLTPLWCPAEWCPAFHHAGSCLSLSLHWVGTFVYFEDKLGKTRLRSCRRKPIPRDTTSVFAWQPLVAVHCTLL